MFSRPIAFGRPCEWATGVASRVLSHELRLATVHFKKEEAVEEEFNVEIPFCASENTGRIFLDYKAQTAQGGRDTQEDRYMCEPDMDKKPAEYPGLCRIGLPTLSFFAVYDGHGGEDAAEVRVLCYMILHYTYNILFIVLYCIIPSLPCNRQCAPGCVFRTRRV